MTMLNHKHFITVKDHSVSGEIFELYMDEYLDLLITYPKPSEDNLARYYESDNYISHTDGKRSLFEKVYHFVKNNALKNKLKLINNEQPDKGSLLDIGSGTGDFLVIAKQNDWAITGIEPNEKAKQIAINKGVCFVSSTKDLDDNSFDLITMWHVLEHVIDLEEQITELKRILKSTGTIIIAVPNYNSFDAKYYNSFWAGFDVPRHLWHFSKKAIQILFQRENLKVIKILPMKWDSFYVSLLSEKYKTGKMNFYKAFCIGWISNRKAKQNREYSSHIYVINNSKNENKSV